MIYTSCSTQRDVPPQYEDDHGVVTGQGFQDASRSRLQVYLTAAALGGDSTGPVLTDVDRTVLGAVAVAGELK
jgi:hypothetical protein